jgi:CBS domain-containing protein
MEETGTVAAILDHKGRDVFTIGPDNTVYEAIERLADRNVGALLVMEGERLLGVFSERDYTRKVALQGRNSKETRVEEVITGRIVTVFPTATVPECLQLMADHRIRHLPVMVGELVEGVISVGDLVNWIIHAQRAQIEQLHSYIQGGYPG